MLHSRGPATAVRLLRTCVRGAEAQITPSAAYGARRLQPRCREGIVSLRQLHTSQGVRNQGAEAHTQVQASPPSQSGLALFLGLVGVTLGLGTWQTSRYWWKHDLLAQREKDLRADVLDSDAAGFATLPPMEGDRVQRATLRGRFLHDKLAVVRPRPPPKGVSEKAMPQLGANAGSNLIVPFVTTSGRTVWVNCGWMLSSPQRPQLPSSDSGVVEIDVVLRAPENPGAWGGIHKEDVGEYSWIDIVSMSRTAALPEDAHGLLYAERLQPTPGPQAGVHAHPLLTRPLAAFSETHVMPDTHLVYAATWYTLAAAGAVMTYSKFGAARAGVKLRRR